MDGIIGPISDPQETTDLQEKSCGNRDPCPLGQQWTRLPFFADARSTATTGAWPSPASTTAACFGRRAPEARRLVGVHEGAIMAPPVAPRKSCYAGKTRAVQGAAPFGGSDGLIWLSRTLELDERT
jgi:hypothetical protein